MIDLRTREINGWSIRWGCSSVFELDGFEARKENIVLPVIKRTTPARLYSMPLPTMDTRFLKMKYPGGVRDATVEYEIRANMNTVMRHENPQVIERRVMEMLDD